MNKGPILLFPTHYLGNFILGLPWLHEVSRCYPGSVVIIDSQFSTLFSACSHNMENVIFYPRNFLSKENGIFTRAWHYFGMIQKIRRVRDRHLIDMEGERFTGVLSLLSGCRKRIGPEGKLSSLFYSDSYKLDYKKHRFNAFGELINKWQQISTPTITPNFKHDSFAGKSITKKFHKAKFPSNLVVLHAGASTENKRWPVSHFAKLNTLLAREGYNVVWVGSGKADFKLVSEIEFLSSHVESFNFCNQLSFPELLALLKISVLFLGADSGPMHLAASVGLPVFGLFGPSDENIWKPLGAKSKVLRGSLHCNKACEGAKCRSNQHCLEFLNPQLVFNTILASTPSLTSRAAI